MFFCDGVRTSLAWYILTKTMTATSKTVVQAQGSNSLDIFRWFRWGLELVGDAAGEMNCLATIASTGPGPNAF